MSEDKVFYTLSDVELTEEKQQELREQMRKCYIDIIVDNVVVSKIPNGDYYLFLSIGESPKTYAEEYINSFNRPSLAEKLSEIEKQTGETAEDAICNYLWRKGEELFDEAKNNKIPRFD